MRRIFALLERRPIVSFTVLLALLAGTIVAASKLRAPEVQPALPVREPRVVSLFTVGTDAPRLPLPAQVKKEGIVNVVNLVPGIVTGIHARVGQNVAAFQTIVSLDNDNGAGSAALRARIATESRILAEKNFSAQKKALNLEAKRDDDAATSDAEEDLAQKRALIGKRSLTSARAMSRLSEELAGSEVQILRPGSPVAGRLAHLGVHIGDFVPAGTVIATVNMPHQSASLEVKIPFTTALALDAEGKFDIQIGEETWALTPRSLSASEDKDGLFTLVLDLPQELSGRVADETFVSINAPLTPHQGALTLLPIDALYQENTESSVHLLDAAQHIVSVPVTVGPVFGSFAAVSGIDPGAVIVTDRSGKIGETVAKPTP